MVDDVDRHYQRTQAGGAKTIAPLEDKPWDLRQFNARTVRYVEHEKLFDLLRVPELTHTTVGVPEPGGRD
jgi:hypothetical protein